MTAAEAVETSVTTTNSISQDYTNLDDHISQMNVLLLEVCWAQIKYQSFAILYKLKQPDTELGCIRMDISTISKRL